MLLAAVLLSSGCHLLIARYHDEKRKFSISLPRFWERDTDVNEAVAISVREPLHGKNDKFQENINVTVTSAAEGAPVDIFYDINKEMAMKTLPGIKYDIVEDERYAGSEMGRSLSFTYIQENLKLRITSVIWAKNSRVYVVTASCEADKYNHYKRIFNEAISSLRLDK
jgi:hypothetical protein